ncbi:unnamed protein product [Fraxinus pennsylvanica]|uniref:Uncharacterized protein n=1 Tax=Fraxinus pennsylvanica TaxID=56036 RepID=A0AAD2AF93_9LAMI|nr:unnamed protein product [Fraxinus pennsylvanica]
MLDEELKIAAADDEVRAAIADKISRERIGHEVCLLCVACMDSTWRLLQLLELSSFTDDQRRLCLYAALFLPFRKTIYTDKKGKKIPVASYIFRNSLKLKGSDAEPVLSLHFAAEKFVSLIPLILSNEDIQILVVDWKREIIDVPDASKLRILAGLLLREIKEFWRAALVLSMLLPPTIIGCPTNPSNKDSEMGRKSELFKGIEKAILDLGLEKVWEMKPLVNGKDIMNVLEIKSGGPVVKEWQQKLLEWQLAHPSGSTDECIDWMRIIHSKCARTEDHSCTGRHRIRNENVKYPTLGKRGYELLRK